MKQYTTTEAYSGNTAIITLNNGKVESEEIVANYELDGYCRRLEYEGYEKAYYVPIFQQKVNELKEELKEAEEYLNIATKSPIIIDDLDITTLKRALNGD